MLSERQSYHYSWSEDLENLRSYYWDLYLLKYKGISKLYLLINAILRITKSKKFYFFDYFEKFLLSLYIFFFFVRPIKVANVYAAWR